MIRSWMVIGAVAIAVSFLSALLKPKDIKWFSRLRRPKWMFFEPLIPVIWSVILICGAWSAYLVWEANPGTTQTWWLMAFYLLVELVIIAYSPVTLHLQSLKAGTIVGMVGFVLGLILTFSVQPISNPAALLLVPYLLWSPVGSYTTWAMDQLNPS